MTGTRRPTQVVALGLMAVTLGALIVRGTAVVALVAPSVFGVLALIAMVRVMIRWPDDPSATRRVLQWTIVAFLAHLAFALVATHAPTPLHFSRTDAVGYHRGAISLVNHWVTGDPLPGLPGGKEGFYYLLGGVYWVLGPHRVAGLAVTATLAAALVPLMSDLTYRQFGREAAKYAAPLVVLLPGIFLWTSQLLKEAPVLFLIAVAAYCAVLITQRVTLAPLVGISAALALLFTFRGPVALVVTGGLLAGIIFGSRQLLGGLGTGLTAMTLVVLLVLTLGVGLSGYESALESDFRQANIVRQDLAKTESGIRPDVDISTPRKALAYLPVGLVDFFLGPFPWQLRSGLQVFSLADVIVWWALLPSLWRGLQATRRRRGGRRALALLLPAAIISVELALVIGNFGTIVRERTQVVILLLPFLALGLAVRAQERSEQVEPIARVPARV